MPVDKKRYPAHWADLTAQVLARAGSCCEHCGIPRWAVGYRTKDGTFVELEVGESYTDATRLRDILLIETTRLRLIVIRLTTAHLDHDEWNDEVKLERLAALCERCHFHYDKHDNRQRKQYGRDWKKHQLVLL